MYLIQNLCRPRDLLLSHLLSGKFRYDHFPAYATNFEIHPKDGEAARHLSPLFRV